MIPFKPVFWLTVLTLLIAGGLGLVTGYVRWETDSYKCLGGKRWYAAVPKQRLYSAGKLKVYYQPMNYGCGGDYRWDTNLYEMKNGTLVPKALDSSPE